MGGGDLGGSGDPLEGVWRLMGGAGERELVLSLVAGGGDHGLRRRWSGERGGGVRRC